MCFTCNMEFKNGNQLHSHNRRLHKNKSLEEKLHDYNEYVKSHSIPIKCFDSQLNYDENIQYWVYAHYTDENEIFYIGVGQISRAYSIRGRNRHHKRVRELYGMNIGIL